MDFGWTEKERMTAVNVSKIVCGGVRLGRWIMNGLTVVAPCDCLLGPLDGAEKMCAGLMGSLLSLWIFAIVLIDGRVLNGMCAMGARGVRRVAGAWAKMRQSRMISRIVVGAIVSVAGCGVFVHFAETLVDRVGRWVLLCAYYSDPVGAVVHGIAHWSLVGVWVWICVKMLPRAVTLVVHEDVPACGVPDEVLDQNDLALGKDNADRLHRDAYVDTLLDVVERAPRNICAQYLGIYGEWGDGKTSVLGIMRKRTGTRKFAYAEYDAWRLSESGALSMSLFAAVAKAIRRESPEAWSCFRDFGVALSLVGKCSRLEGIPYVGEAVGRLLRGWLDVDEVKGRLAAALRKYQGRLIVAIDDLDRLTPDEVYRVLRMIKANGDLPNLTYLVLADKEYVARCLDRVIGAGEGDGRGLRYLEKIVTDEFPLPAVLPSEFYSKFLRDLGQLRKRYPEFRRFGPTNESLKVIFHYLRNLRSEKRLTKSIEKELAFQCQKAKSRGKKYPDVCFEDLIELTAIKLFREDVYSALYRNREKIWASSGLTPSGSRSDALSDNFVNQVLLCNATGDERRVLLGFLKDRVGVQGGPVGYRYVMPKPSETVECRLSSCECFEYYFCTADRQVASMVTKDLLGAVLDSSPDVLAVVNALNAAQKQYVLPQLLSALRFADKVREGDLVVCKTILEALAILSREHFHSEKRRSFFYTASPYAGDGAYIDILRAFKAVSSAGMKEEPARTRFVLNLLHQNDHFTLPALLYMDEVRTIDGQEPRYFSETGMRELREFVLACGRMFSERLMDYPDELIVRRAWRHAVERTENRERKEEYCKALGGEMRRYPDVAHALWPFLTPYGNDESNGIVTIDYRGLEEHISASIAEDTLRQVAEERLEAMRMYEVYLLEALRFCRRSAMKGKQCGQHDQRSYLLALPDANFENFVQKKLQMKVKHF